MKKLVITETGTRAHMSHSGQLGWLIGVLSGAIQWNDGLTPDTRKFLFSELMAVLDPVKDEGMIKRLTKSMGEQGFEVREKVTEPNLLHE